MRTSHRQLLTNQRYGRWFDQSRPSYARERLRFVAGFCEALRVMLAAAGIDPARMRGLRSGDEAATILAAIPDTPELQRFDAEMMAANPMPTDPRLPWPTRDRDEANQRRAAQGYAEGKEPNWDICSLADAEAFCIARLCPEEWGLKVPAAPPTDPLPAGGEREGPVAPRREG